MAAGEHSRFPASLTTRLTTDPLRISPIVRLELDLLWDTATALAAGSALATKDAMLREHFPGLAVWD